MIRNCGSRRIPNNKEDAMRTITMFIVLIAFVLASPGLGTAMADEYNSAISTFRSLPEVQPLFESCYD